VGLWNVVVGSLSGERRQDNSEKKKRKIEGVDWKMKCGREVERVDTYERD